ncbi:MAG: type III-B CRISPR-associated protein Cas10/Cmr2 [Rubrobacter sp.]|jgi:CRISPR-associated protein Cmr2|nr:type III-B CRISPR-associated protein Cas10/Cmr2 [Rubrobacter sp.]
MKQLHFTFGPVQEFVSEARKTADLWCGSYLISYLAAHAIDGALEAGAKEEDFFPRIAGNPLLAAVRWPKEHPKDANDPAASVGSLPNRFSLLVNSDESGRELARAADEGFGMAWLTAYDACWRRLTEHHHPLRDRAGIWDRQVDSLWETSWVISEDHRALAQRKLMRVFSPSEEPGRKCTVCGRREELGNRSFWQPLSRSLGAGFLNADKERLCAVCLVKRTLPRVGREAFGWEVLGESFPSTPDLASDGWRRRVAAGSELREAREALAAVAEKPFDRLEGGFFYPSYHEELVEGAALEELGKKLSALYSVAGAPRPTYAILAMDGDNMGARLSRLDEGGRKTLSERILDFSLWVRATVERDGGASRLIYAGGEDVLALLPMDATLDAAWRVRELYKETFKGFDESHREKLGGDSTISAGLLYCPMTLPLRTAMREAHRLLDEDAKDGAGRDALAVGVWKGGGEILKVARKWDDQDWVEELLDMTAGEEPPYPSRFLYQAQEIAGGPAGDAGTLEKLLALEYYGSREEKFKTRGMDEAEERIASLVRISKKDDRLDPALFRLVRFFYEEGA